MSDEHEHHSPIKTPKQLIFVIVVSFLIPIVLIVMLSQLMTAGIETNDYSNSEPMIAARLKPVGSVDVTDPNAPKVEKSGKEVVDAVCSACHGSGALGAPKIGDKGDWGKRIAEGFPTLSQHAILGIRQMPARGGNPDLSDIEVARAVAYMADQAGATFKEPAAGAAPAPVVAKAAPAKK